MSLFKQYIGIDYSGAQTPTSSLKGIRVYKADSATLPSEVQSPPSPRKYWSRKGIAQWLLEELQEDHATIVGLDHSFSFPMRYFEVHTCRRIGRHFSMISNVTGQRMRIMSMLIS